MDLIQNRLAKRGAMVIPSPLAVLLVTVPAPPRGFAGLDYARPPNRCTVIEHSQNYPGIGTKKTPL